MQKILAALTSALEERLAIIGDEKSRRDLTAHTARLRAASEKIETFERQLPATIDPQLRHFLQRRSYSKALELLNSSAPQGAGISANTIRRSTAR